MTSPGLGVNTDRLAKCEPAFVSLSRRVEQIRAGLDAKLRSAGECWGGPDDKLGKAFADKYVDPSKQISEGLTNMVEVLSSVADGIRTMAKGAVHTEEQATEQATVALRTGNRLDTEGTPVTATRGYAVSKMAEPTTEPLMAARTMTARTAETTDVTPLTAARTESIPAQMSPLMTARVESIPAQPLLHTAERTESTPAQPLLHTAEATPMMVARTESIPAQVSPMMAGRVEAAPVLQPMQGRLVSDVAEPLAPTRVTAEATPMMMTTARQGEARIVADGTEPVTGVTATRDVMPPEDQAVTLRRILDGQG